MVKANNKTKDASKDDKGIKCRIVILDDQSIFCEGVKRIIEQRSSFQVVGIFGRKAPAFDFIRTEKPDLVLLELNLGQDVGLEVVKDACAQFDWLRVLVFTSLDELIYGERALHAGARGFLPKNCSAETLLNVITTVMRDEIFMSEPLMASLLKRVYLGNQGGRPSQANSVASLSDREFEVFELIGRGKGTREIAACLKLGIKTVENHREKIKKKLVLASGSSLVHYATIWMHEMTASKGNELMQPGQPMSLMDNTIPLPRITAGKQAKAACL